MKIVEAGSFSRAAAVLYVAQPALSSQIAELEQELGMKLLVRGARGVKPTGEGELLYREAIAFLQRFDQLSSKVRSAGPTVSGEVRLGMSNVFTHVLAGPFMRVCRASLPDITIRLSSDGSTELRGKLLDHELDLALVVEEDPVAGLSRTELFRQRMYVLHVDASHRDTTSIRFADLATWPLLSPHDSWRGSLEKRFAASGLKANIVGHTQDLGSHLAAVAAGIGAIILPIGDPSSVPGAERIIATPISDFLLTGSLVHAHDTHLSRAAEAVRALLVPFILRYIEERQPRGIEPLEP